MTVPSWGPPTAGTTVVTGRVDRPAPAPRGQGRMGRRADPSAIRELPIVNLQVTTEDHEGWTVLFVAGEVDFAVVPELGEHVRRAVAQGRHQLILELTRVVFLDSTGIGALVGARRLLRSCSGELRLVMPESTDHHVNRVFTALGLRRLFDVHPTLDEALADEDTTGAVAAG